MDERIDKVEREIAAKSELLLQARRLLKAEPQNTDAQADVEHYEKEVSQLREYLTALATAHADKERWFKLLEDEKKRESVPLYPPGWQELVTLLIRHTLTGAPTTLSKRKIHFKMNLKECYECDGPVNSGMTRCMLLDTYLPSAIVTAAHLFRRSNQYIASQLLNIEDIDDVKNGLLLFKPLEKAFDHFQIGFIYNSTDDIYRLKIFNDVPVFKNTLLIDSIPEGTVLKDMNLDLSALPKDWRISTEPVLAPGTQYDLRTKFADLEGKPIAFKNLNRPFRRCLNLQARIALTEAIDKKTIDDSFNFQDYWSDGISVDEKLQFYFEKTADV
jgi:hypothetical protein